MKIIKEFLTRIGEINDNIKEHKKNSKEIDNLERQLELKRDYSTKLWVRSLHLRKMTDEEWKNAKR